MWLIRLLKGVPRYLWMEKFGIHGLLENIFNYCYVRYGSNISQLQWFLNRNLKAMGTYIIIIMITKLLFHVADLRIKSRHRGIAAKQR